MNIGRSIVNFGSKFAPIYDRVLELERKVREPNEDQRSLEDSSRLAYVETEKANYGIHSGVHILPSDIGQDLIEDSDAIILESGSGDYESISEEQIRDGRLHLQYNRLLERNNEKNPSDIYFVDTPSRIGKYSYFFTEVGFKTVLPYNRAGGSLTSLNPMLAPLAVPFISSVYGGLTARATGFGEKPIGYLQTSQFYTGTGLRSAISARKMEEFVAPKVGEEVDGKPDILVDYGSGHLDLIPYLNHSKLRDSVISFNSLMEYYPIDKDHLDKVCEFSYSDVESPGELPAGETSEAQEITLDKEIYELPELAETPEMEWDEISSALSNNLRQKVGINKLLE